MLHRVHRQSHVPDVTVVVGRSGAPETDGILEMQDSKERHS